MWVLSEDDVRNIQKKFGDCENISDREIRLSLIRAYISACADCGDWKTDYQGSGISTTR